MIKNSEEVSEANLMEPKQLNLLEDLIGLIIDVRLDALDIKKIRSVFAIRNADHPMTIDSGIFLLYSPKTPLSSTPIVSYNPIGWVF